MRKKLERQNPQALKMKMWLYPYTTYITILCIITILTSMAFIKSTQSQFFSTLVLALLIVIFYNLFNKKRKVVKETLPTKIDIGKSEHK